MEPTSKKAIVAISGFAGAGKDTLAKATAWHLAQRGIGNTVTVKFADELKEAINQALMYLGLPAIAFTEDRSLKEQLRPLMKELGIYARKQDIDIFAKLVAGIIQSRVRENDVIFITDMRYLNEYRIIHNAAAQGGWYFRPIYVHTYDKGPANEEEDNSISALLAEATYLEKMAFRNGDLNDFDMRGQRIAADCFNSLQ